MNANTLAREVVPSLRVISAETAAREGYRPITVPINPKTEPHIFSSIQSGLKGANAVWVSDPMGKRFTAARKASELIEVNGGDQ
jgi:hypothetical protein